MVDRPILSTVNGLTPGVSSEPLQKFVGTGKGRRCPLPAEGGSHRLEGSVVAASLLVSPAGIIRHRPPPHIDRLEVKVGTCNSEEMVVSWTRVQCSVWVRFEFRWRVTRMHHQTTAARFDREVKMCFL